MGLNQDRSTILLCPSLCLLIKLFVETTIHWVAGALGLQADASQLQLRPGLAVHHICFVHEKTAASLGLKPADFLFNLGPHSKALTTEVQPLSELL